MSIVNISSYKFIMLEKIATLRVELKAKCIEIGIKGTILLSPEIININLAGTREQIDEFTHYLRSDPRFADIIFKESLSQEVPFSKLAVRVKKEVLPLEVEINQNINKSQYTISPNELKQWYDEGRDFTIVDTRNDYEYDLGSFDNALSLNIHNFREYPEAIQKLSQDKKDKPMVIFCTGGIRCDKVLPWMLQHGFPQTYQLEGGILNYFAECGGEHYRGECFIFDDRVSVDSNLQETGTSLCVSCQHPVTKVQQDLMGFVQNHQCETCYDIRR